MQPKAELRDYLAVERTFLAWIRTGLALMGFGFVVARFGLFFQQIQLVDHAAPAQPSGLSLWFGTALIAAGILVHLGSAWRHVRLVRQLDQGDTGSSRSLSYAVTTALFLAAVGLAMAIYLLSVRKSAAGKTACLKEEITMPGDMGINSKLGNDSDDQTVAKLKNILQAKDVALLAAVDGSDQAIKAGLSLPSTKLRSFDETPTCSVADHPSELTASGRKRTEGKRSP